jgi:hypothetical protein
MLFQHQINAIIQLKIKKTLVIVGIITQKNSLTNYLRNITIIDMFIYIYVTN